MSLIEVSRHIGGEVVVLTPKVHEDPRGFFMETYREDRFRALGLPTRWAQDNHSSSARGVVRGLHFQWDPPMGKLMRVTRGAAHLVAVDVRKGSPTLGRSFGIECSEWNRLQVFAPWGFARGFAALTDEADVQYKCTAPYHAAGEAGILWNDPALGIEWPVRDPVLSPKDRCAPTLAQWLARPESDLVRYEGVPALPEVSR